MEKHFNCSRAHDVRLLAVSACLGILFPAVPAPGQ